MGRFRVGVTILGIGLIGGWMLFMIPRQGDTQQPSATPTLEYRAFAPLAIRGDWLRRTLFLPLVMQQQPVPTLRPTPTMTPSPTPTPAPTFNPATTAIRLEGAVRGFNAPTSVTHAGDGSGRLFVTEKFGAIRLVRAGVISPTPFLNLSALVNASSTEQGLLGLAFHPRFPQTGYFYVTYTAQNGATVLARYTVSADPDQADHASALILLTIPQPSDAHKSGALAFGPDGYLYVGVGDGDIEGDREGNAQNPNSLLGKLLRLDVDGGMPYAIPADNPLVGQPGHRPEVWALGLRNPWRFSFDRATGDLYMGDVGAERAEEINFQPATSRGGENYGWNVMEGTGCVAGASGCDRTRFIPPIIEYFHRDRCAAVIGGYVYRGSRQPALWGAYLFTDLCRNSIWALTRHSNGSWLQTLVYDQAVGPSSMGEDESGELYITDIFSGWLLRIVATPRL